MKRIHNISAQDRQVNTFDELEELLLGEGAETAKTAGVTVVEKGVVDPEIISAIEADLDSEWRKMGVRERVPKHRLLSVFNIVGDNPSSGLLHRHDTVVALGNTATPTVFAMDDAALDALFLDELKRVEEKIDARLWEIEFPDYHAWRHWRNIRGDLKSGESSQEIQKVFHYFLDPVITKQEEVIMDIANELARKIQQELELEGKLGVIDWTQADFAIIDEETGHGRDGRTENVRPEGEKVANWHLNEFGMWAWRD